MNWWETPASGIDLEAESRAMAHQRNLTKPPGSLARLEELAVRLAALQGETCPRVDPARILVFAGDHGVAASGVSAYPQAVTAQMVANMARGGAAVSVLARELDVELQVLVLGLAAGADQRLPEGVRLVGPGGATADLSRAPAMTEPELRQCLAAGRDAVERAHGDGCRLLIGGEMGIGNTTAAAALACALLRRAASDLAGPGTGLDEEGIARKVAIIGLALARHGDAIAEPLEALRRLGGFEIAALTGLYLRAAQLGVPVLVDGFIATSAALVACRLSPSVRDWLLFAHRSNEQGHGPMLESLGARPLLDLGLRLGEASGAAAALPLLRLACALHSGMASFAEAGVSNRGS